MVKHKVLLTPGAKKSIKSIHDYYSRFISKHMAKNINQGIRRDIRLLAEHPKLGTVETLANKDYFVFVSVNYKIIYTVNTSANELIVLEVFDARQNPTKLNP